ncbi:MAG: CRISPR system precrRNA processing endoribonuclease RAMP protein Cas6 [Desulfomonilia bacterium]|jgi:hypothetical protein
MIVQFGRYDFSCVFKDDALLPVYKGSTFRGVLGHALKKVVCALRRQTCRDCLLRQSCVYAVVFEGVHDDGPAPEKRRLAAPPNAYVIEPPLEKKVEYKAGESLDFSLLLFGRATDFLPYFIYAVEQIGKSGIGKRLNGKAGGFELKAVSYGKTVLYSAEARKVEHIQAARRDISLADSTEDEGDVVRKLKISLLTPLRLKYQSRLEPQLPFHVLIRAALRRVSSLMAYHGDGEPELDYKDLVRRAMRVATSESSIRWYDWKRYSNRQEQEMFLGGMVGDITYAEVPSEYLPILRFCEEVHLGKQTAFGLGKFRIDTAAG